MVIFFGLCLLSYRFFLKSDSFETPLLKSIDDVSSQKVITIPPKILNELVIEQKNQFEVNNETNLNIPLKQSELSKPLLPEGAIPLEIMIEEFRKKSLQSSEESRKSPFEK